MYCIILPASGIFRILYTPCGIIGGMVTINGTYTHTHDNQKTHKNEVKLYNYTKLNFISKFIFNDCIATKSMFVDYVQSKIHSGPSAVEIELSFLERNRFGACHFAHVHCNLPLLCLNSLARVT